MKSLLDRLRSKTEKLSNKEYIFYMTMLGLIVSILLTPLYENYFLKDTTLYESNINLIDENFSLPKSILILVFDVGLITPILESLLFQYLPIELYFRKSKIKKLGELELIFILSLIFGLAHLFFSKSLIKGIHSFIIGLILNYAYLDYRIRDRSGLLICTLLHMSFNLFIPITNLIINLI